MWRQAAWRAGACGGKGSGTARLNGSTCQPTAADRKQKKQPVEAGAAVGGATVAAGGSCRCMADFCHHLTLPPSVAHAAVRERERGGGAAAGSTGSLSPPPHTPPFPPQRRALDFHATPLPFSLPLPPPPQQQVLQGEKEERRAAGGGLLVTPITPSPSPPTPAGAAGREMGRSGTRLRQRLYVRLLRVRAGCCCACTCRCARWRLLHVRLQLRVRSPLLLCALLCVLLLLAWATATRAGVHVAAPRGWPSRARREPSRGATSQVVEDEVEDDGFDLAYRGYTVGTDNDESHSDHLGYAAGTDDNESDSDYRRYAVRTDDEEDNNGDSEEEKGDNDNLAEEETQPVTPPARDGGFGGGSMARTQWWPYMELYNKESADADPHAVDGGGATSVNVPASIEVPTSVQPGTSTPTFTCAC
ncbi:unnamed protein product [Closterium sp. NIES-53]